MSATTATKAVKILLDTYAKLRYWAEVEGMTVDELVNTLLEFNVNVDTDRIEA